MAAAGWKAPSASRRNAGCFVSKNMAYPVPIVECDCCEGRFILDPEAMVEDIVLEIVQLLCRTCRPEEEGGEMT